jgi:DNA topoisomerase-1
MPKTLLIVESPAKARTLTKFLGKDYIVKASMGHIRDLPKNKISVDVENNFQPEYVISPDKKKVVTELKKLIKKDTKVLLATDEDREGEAISWHLIKALGLKEEKRIVFHEITKKAILDALKNPRDLDYNLVDAQQARRIIDRIVGYELSPVLWKKIKMGLSAGRVQSVALRIIVEREREIENFKPEEFWKITAKHISPDFTSELFKKDKKKIKITNSNQAEKVKKETLSSDFYLDKIIKKLSKRNPSPPFTTSTLQQEASRKLGFSVKQTMILAQKLYEGNFDIPNYSGGLITYMRTDSVNLSSQALKQAKTIISKEYGKEYVLDKARTYQTKSKGAQEAHEAIRPVDLSILPDKLTTILDPQLKKLYELIWNRTVATQMKEAEINLTTFSILAGKNKEYEFVSKGEQIKFLGFMKVYTEDTDEGEEKFKTKLLPDLKEGTVLKTKDLLLEQCFTKPLPRYTEASLVKQLEKLGIGRPSTYAPTISTIQTRLYIEKNEQKKLVPTDIGKLVNDFLVKHFSDIVDYNFTATMEEDLDKVSLGKIKWQNILKNFYPEFIENIKIKKETVSREEAQKERVLGTDPKTKKTVKVRMGRFGPLVQIGEKDDEEKPKFASLPKELKIEEVKLDEVLYLFDLPRTLKGEKGDILINIGRFGPYFKYDNKNYSLKNYDPFKVNLAEIKEIIKEKEEQEKNKYIKEFESGIQVLNGPFGPYIKYQKNNYRIPKKFEAKDLDEKQCLEIIKSKPKTKKKKK